MKLAGTFPGVARSRRRWRSFARGLCCCALGLEGQGGFRIGLGVLALMASLGRGGGGVLE